MSEITTTKIATENTKSPTKLRNFNRVDHFLTKKLQGYEEKY